MVRLNCVHGWFSTGRNNKSVRDVHGTADSVLFGIVAEEILASAKSRIFARGSLTMNSLTRDKNNRQERERTNFEVEGGHRHTRVSLAFGVDLEDLAKIHIHGNIIIRGSNSVDIENRR